jgi:hypothetical protein
LSRLSLPFRAIYPDATALQRVKLSRLQGFAAMSKKKQVLPFWAESADSFEKPSQRRRVLRPSHNIRLGTNEFFHRADGAVAGRGQMDQS